MTHIIDGEFQSDKYPTTPRGKVPLSVKDPTAQDLLWTYAQRRRSVDAGFSDDLETALRAAGHTPAAIQSLQEDAETVRRWGDRRLLKNESGSVLRELAHQALARLAAAAMRADHEVAALMGLAVELNEGVPVDESFHGGELVGWLVSNGIAFIRNSRVSAKKKAHLLEAARLIRCEGIIGSQWLAERAEWLKLDGTKIETLPWNEGGRDEYYSKLPGDAALVRGDPPSADSVATRAMLGRAYVEGVASVEPKVLCVDPTLCLDCKWPDSLGHHAACVKRISRFDPRCINCGVRQSEHFPRSRAEYADRDCPCNEFTLGSVDASVRPSGDGDSAVIRAAEGVTLEPGEYEVVSGTGYGGSNIENARFSLSSAVNCYEKRLWSVVIKRGVGWVSAVRRIETKVEHPDITKAIAQFQADAPDAFSHLGTGNVDAARDELTLAAEHAGHRPVSSLRCKVTGNPCGTDTWMVGSPCRCASCQEYLASKAASTPQLPGDAALVRGDQPEPMHPDRKQRGPQLRLCNLGTGHDGDCNGEPTWYCPPLRAQKAREAAAWTGEGGQVTGAILKGKPMSEEVANQPDASGDSPELAEAKRWRRDLLVEKDRNVTERLQQASSLAVIGKLISALRERDAANRTIRELIRLTAREQLVLGAAENQALHPNVLNQRTLCATVDALKNGYDLCTRCKLKPRSGDSMCDTCGI